MIARLGDAVIASLRYLQFRSFRSNIDPALKSDRRFVLLVTGFPPDISGGVYRPASLAKYAPQFGWNPTVVTHPAPTAHSEAGNALLEYVGPHARVLRTPAEPLQPSHRLFLQVDGSMVAAMDMADCIRREFGSDLPRVIVGSGPSFSTFVAAYLTVLGTDRKLVLEYRDEWTLCPFDFVSKTTADLEWEKRCLGRADLIILTTQSQKDYIEQTFPALVTGKCEVVPNGWEPALLLPASQNSIKDENSRDELWLTFAGMLGDYADPSVFLKTLAVVLTRRADLLARVRVRFVGKKRPLMKSRLQEFPIQGVVHDVDHVPPAEAKRLMRDSGAVLLFHSPQFERYIPGKLYEYAASGTPIVLFDDVGESSRIVRKLNLGKSMASADGAGLEAALDALVALDSAQRLQSRPAANSDLGRWLEAHTRKALAAQFFDLIDSRIVKGW